MSKITVGKYILERLVQVGVTDIFGVPGDFNLRWLDDVEDHAKLNWIGCANELNAAYSADGYARTKPQGLGCLVTTFGVGELSAVNGVAGAYSERIPLLHIVGVPSTKLQGRHALLHHTLGDGKFDAYVNVASNVTSDQFVLTKADQAHEFVDQAIIRALSKARPTYLTLPTDLVTVEISAAPLDKPLNALELIKQPSFEPASDGTLQHAVKAIVELYEKSERPVILVDACVIRYNVQKECQALIEATGLTFFTSPMGKGALNESHKQFGGVYVGEISVPEIKDAIKSSDLVIHLGSLKSDFNTGGFSYQVTEAQSVELHSDHTQVQYAQYDRLGFRRMLPALTKALSATKSRSTVKKIEGSGLAEELPKSEAQKDEKIVQDAFWPHLSTFLRDDDVILAETGTSLFGILDARFKDRTTFIGQVLYGSIGYTGGAVLGASIAAKLAGRRVILCIGDGSMQLTVQEIGTLIRHGLKPIILLLNNDGYVIERQIHGANRVYNDIGHWQWQQTLSFFGADPKTSASYLVKTNAEFDKLWQDPKFANAEQLSLVEIIVRVAPCCRADAPSMDPHDAPRALREQAAMTEKVNEEA